MRRESGFRITAYAGAVAPRGFGELLVDAFAEVETPMDRVGAQTRVQAWPEYAAQPGFRAVLAEHDDRLVGVALGWETDESIAGPASPFRALEQRVLDQLRPGASLLGSLSLVELAVARHEQGAGLGRELLGAFVDDRACWLVTNPATPAHAWYRRLGWQDFAVATADGAYVAMMREGRRVGEIIRVAAALITDRDGRALLVRKRGTEAFMQPGGKPEPGERGIQTIRRELREEVGLELSELELPWLGWYEAVAANEGGHWVKAEVFRAVVDAAAVSPQAEIDRAVWVDPAQPGELPLAPLSRVLLPLARDNSC